MARGKDGRTLPFSPKCHLCSLARLALSWHVAREICCTAWRLGQGASSSCKDHELCNQTDFRVGIRRCHRTSPVTLNKPVHLPRPRSLMCKLERLALPP